MRSDPLLDTTPAGLDLRSCETRQLLNPPPVTGLRLLERQDGTDSAPRSPSKSPSDT